MSIVPIILAGGFGARLWPLSRQKKPKQFVHLFEEKSLFQKTLERVRDLQELASLIVVCNNKHHNLVKKQLQEIGINNVQLILEPIGRGTAPAIAIAAFKLIAKDLDPILLVLPSDHVISENSKFHDAIAVAKKHAKQNFLACFGILPSRPEIGYGYIEFGEQLDASKVFKISKFVEKPNIELAKQYVDSGKYYWNSGMFMFRASAYLEELKKNAPDIYKVCEDVACKCSKSSLDDVFKINIKKFSACRSDSIDYAIMEKTNNAVAVPLNVGWSDLGSWQMLWEYGKKDSSGNVVFGDVDVKDTNNSFIHATNRKVVALGINNYIIVETKDSVLVVSRDSCQDVKSIVDSLVKKHI